MLQPTVPNMLPAGLGLRLATPTLLAALDLSASFTLPVALDLFASSITPAALGPSANTLLSATLDSHSARPSNLSAVLGLHVASWNSNKTLQLIAGYFFPVRFKQ
jgi:hypothetical protein